MTKCCGIKNAIERYVYDEAQTRLAIQTIETIRAIMVREKPSFATCTRFMSNEMVYATLTSWAPPKEFWVEPFTWARAALDDCLDREWWYRCEKEW